MLVVTGAGRLREWLQGECFDRLQRQLITRGPRFHGAGDFGARCCCLFFARLSLKGEIASERTQAFTLSKETIEGITYLVVRLFG